MPSEASVCVRPLSTALLRPGASCAKAAASNIGDFIGRQDFLNDRAEHLDSMFSYHLPFVTELLDEVDVAVLDSLFSAVDGFLVG
jgi:hypothetical protein